MLKKMPQYQKELNAYALHLTLAEDCVKRFNPKIKQLCDVEQNLVMGTDSQGEKIKDPMKIIVPLLLDHDIKVEDKLRLIMLFLLNKNGISEENLQKLLGHAMIPEANKQCILNLQNLGLQILQDAKVSWFLCFCRNRFFEFQFWTFYLNSKRRVAKMYRKIARNAKVKCISCRDGRPMSRISLKI
jgi:hypothetical protein